MLDIVMIGIFIGLVILFIVFILLYFLFYLFIKYNSEYKVNEELKDTIEVFLKNSVVNIIDVYESDEIIKYSDFLFWHDNNYLRKVLTDEELMELDEIKIIWKTMNRGVYVVIAGGENLDSEEILDKIKNSYKLVHIYRIYWLGEFDGIMKNINEILRLCRGG